MTTYNQFAERQGVAIPIIQRDYVQGLDSNFTQRDKFLRKILEALDSGKKFEIDFIYGSSENYGGEEYFQPVDGQQRLSTLAIMGWLLNQKAGNVYDETFKKFTKIRSILPLSPAGLRKGGNPTQLFRPCFRCLTASTPCSANTRKKEFWRWHGVSLPNHP